MNNININKNSNQSGRSMIEMLGVLAIVGVLSVGGIAGYSKAMEKFKINKTIDQVSHIIANVRTLYAQQTTYSGLSGETAYQMGIIPSELGSHNQDGEFTNSFNGRITINANLIDNNYFQVAIDGLDEKLCVTFASYDWGSSSSSGLAAITVGGGDISPAWKYPYVDISYPCDGLENSSYIIACTNGKTISTPINIVEATKICKNCSDSQFGCSLALTLK